MYHQKLSASFDDLPDVAIIFMRLAHPRMRGQHEKLS